MDFYYILWCFKGHIKRFSSISLNKTPRCG